MKSNVIILLFSISFSVVFSRTWHVLWERKYCNSTLPNGFVYPFNTNCSLCISDQLRLFTPNSENFENIYRVRTEQEMLSCNATNALNSLPTIFNTEIVFTLINSGSSDKAFNFYLGEEIYFISTSDGTEVSAKNHLFSREGSCLQFSFVLLASSQNCGNFDSCEMKSVFTDNYSEVGCNLHSEPIESRNFTQSTVTHIYSEYNTTENNIFNNSTSTIFPTLFNGLFRKSFVYIAISLFVCLIGITVGLVSLIMLHRAFYRRKRILQVQYELEKGVGHLGVKNRQESEKNKELSNKDSFEFIQP